MLKYIGYLSIDNPDPIHYHILMDLFRKANYSKFQPLDDWFHNRSQYTFQQSVTGTVSVQFGSDPLGAQMGDVLQDGLRTYVRRMGFWIPLWEHHDIVLTSHGIGLVIQNCLTHIVVEDEDGQTYRAYHSNFDQRVEPSELSPDDWAWIVLRMMK